MLHKSTLWTLEPWMLILCQLILISSSIYLQPTFPVFPEVTRRVQGTEMKTFPDLPLNKGAFYVWGWLGAGVVKRFISQQNRNFSSFPYPIQLFQNDHSFQNRPVLHRKRPCFWSPSRESLLIPIVHSSLVSNPLFDHIYFSVISSYKLHLYSVCVCAEVRFTSQRSRTPASLVQHGICFF